MRRKYHLVDRLDTPMYQKLWDIERDLQQILQLPSVREMKVNEPLPSRDLHKLELFVEPEFLGH